jgi:Ca2+-binding RTX toxin-like protein
MATYRGTSGPDFLVGTDDDDTYFVTEGDVLSDPGGRDTVRTYISWDLGAGFENLVILGDAATSSQGNDLDNRMVGNDADNYFNARGGDDTLIGGGGDDYFDMSPGDTSSPGNDSIAGGSGIDTVDFDGYARSALVADLKAGTVIGGGEGGAGFSIVHGIERFIGGAFDDRITGNDTFGGGTALSTYLDGRGGNDSIVGGNGAEELHGGAGNDTLDGGWYAIDTLDGGDGDDTYIAGYRDQLVDSGGIDTVHAMRVDWRLAPGFENLELHGYAYSDGHFRGVGNADSNLLSVSTPWGSFILDGAGGDDTLIGGSGSDTFQFRAAADYGHDRVDGGDDNDMLSFGRGALSSVVVNLKTGIAVGGGIDGTGRVTFSNVENVSGGDFDDRLVADDAVLHTTPWGHEWFGAHTMNGGGGDDTIIGGAGNDMLGGQGGDDSVKGGDGDDWISGGGGDDYLVGGSGRDGLTGSLGDDTLDGGAGRDVLYTGRSGPSGHDVYDGGGGIDTLDASNAISGGLTVNLGLGTLRGGDEEGGSFTLIDIEVFISGVHDDVIRGTAGVQLHGGQGNDTLTSVGGEVLSGGYGHDLLIGSAGVDRFQFEVASTYSADVVQQFTHGTDEIVLAYSWMWSVGKWGELADGDARFYAAPGAVAGREPDDRIIYNTATGQLFFDVDGWGDSKPQLICTLDGHPILTAGDITVI